MTYKRVDANQVQIVGYFRKLGCSVMDCSPLGKGRPDIIVGYRGINMLCEIKDGSKPLSARTLTDAEIDFHESWRGKIVIIESFEDCIAILESIDAYQENKP